MYEYLDCLAFVLLQSVSHQHKAYASADISPLTLTFCSVHKVT